MQSAELTLDIVQFSLAFMVDLLDFFLEYFGDFGLELAHGVAIVALDDLLELGLLVLNVCL